ncbi:hypothetical protein EDB35_1542 [Vibrio crassostreae]|nr:hypothetical protein EDB35_1542 [Vibrio crassostreae]
MDPLTQGVLGAELSFKRATLGYEYPVVIHDLLM